MLDKEYWRQVGTWLPEEQIAHYSEIVESLNESIRRGELTEHQAALQLRGAAFVLNCSPPDTGYIASSALLADEVCRDPDRARASREWRWILQLSRVGSGRAVSEE